MHFLASGNVGDEINEDSQHVSGLALTCTNSFLNYDEPGSSFIVELTANRFARRIPANRLHLNLRSVLSPKIAAKLQKMSVNSNL